MKDKCLSPVSQESHCVCHWHPSEHGWKSSIFSQPLVVQIFCNLDRNKIIKMIKICCF